MAKVKRRMKNKAVSFIKKYTPPTKQNDTKYIYNVVQVIFASNFYSNSLIPMGYTEGKEHLPICINSEVVLTKAFSSLGRAMSYIKLDNKFKEIDVTDTTHILYNVRPFPDPKYLKKLYYHETGSLFMIFELPIDDTSEPGTAIGKFYHM